MGRQASARRGHLTEDSSAGLRDFPPEVARAGFKDGLDGRGEASSGDGAAACPLESALLQLEFQRVAPPRGVEGASPGCLILGDKRARAVD